jgi:hypothetical protein
VANEAATAKATGKRIAKKLNLLHIDCPPPQSPLVPVEQLAPLSTSGCRSSRSCAGLAPWLPCPNRLQWLLLPGSHLCLSGRHGSAPSAGWSVGSPWHGDGRRPVAMTPSQ